MEVRAGNDAGGVGDGPLDGGAVDEGADDRAVHHLNPSAEKDSPCSYTDQ